jgi:D-alanyl-lipoteichoic acid acyltransferase DltB (MBOAT superfamily)
VLFNSFIFLLFALIYFAGWPAVRNRPVLKYAYIVVCSLFFYGFNEPIYILLLAFTGFIDFVAGLMMERYLPHRKAILLFSLIANISVLAVFKYSGFLATNLNALLGLDLPVPNLTLPIGISFYTFQSMNYTISVYRGDIRATRNPLHFFAFIALFPHLVAGPLVRASDILPQLRECRGGTDKQVWDGLQLIAKGFFKKNVLADNFAPAVNAAFAGVSDNPGGSLYWWTVGLLFSAQIYCDFSGYTDIARGLAKWMGVEFTVNFNHPYSAVSMRDFWQRWHISLSTWFRDYVYIPLGGSRGSMVQSLSNMWVTMLISGLWHGASWTYVIWAALHAGYLSLERVSGWPARVRLLPGGSFACALIVNLLACVAWIFFRATSLGDAALILQRMLSLDWWRSSDLLLIRNEIGTVVLAWLALFWAAEAWNFLREHYFRRLTIPDWAQPLAVGALLAASVFLRGPGGAFIYFQF